jgi:hypothetical protein
MPSSECSGTSRALTCILTNVTQESQDKDSNKQLAAMGAIIKPLDLSAPDAADVLDGIDVLIAAPAAPAVPLQTQLVRAAHAANVKLFVPAEWGGDDSSSPTYKLKESIRSDAEALGLPTVSFFGGVWTDRLSMLGFDLKNLNITIRGWGETPISVTSEEDIARYAAHALTHFSRDQLNNAKFHVEGDRIVCPHPARRATGCD